jgi:hypothetical protein
VPDLYAAFILPPILSAFRRDYPRIRIELCCALSRPLVARVKEGSGCCSGNAHERLYGRAGRWPGAIDMADRGDIVRAF